MPALWAAVSSALFVSGPLQYLFVDWAKTSLALGSVLVVVLCVNFRYCMYGLSLLERFKGAGPWTKFYLIMGITDETYALQMNCRLPPGRALRLYCLFLTALDHAYWVLGVTAGAVAGSLAQSVLSPENVQRAIAGIDFAMTALFIVILVDQCRERANRAPAAIGAVASTAVFLALAAVFGLARARADMLIPSIVLIVAAELVLRGRLEGGGR